MRASHNLVVLALWLLTPTAALACPACKDAVFDSSQAQQTTQRAKGFAVSIALMLGMPALLIGGVATSVVLAHRSAARRAPPSQEGT